jgi:hypothetical protein
MGPLWEVLQPLGNVLIFVGPLVLCGVISTRLALGCRTPIGAFFAAIAGSIGLMIILGPIAGIAFEVFNPLSPGEMCCVPRFLVVGIWEVFLGPVVGVFVGLCCGIMVSDRNRRAIPYKRSADDLDFPGLEPKAR